MAAILTFIVTACLISQYNTAASNNPMGYFSRQQDKFLMNSTTLEFIDTSLIRCAVLCVQHGPAFGDQECKSFNYQRDTEHCWLNNQTADDAPSDLVPMMGRDYYQKEGSP